MRRSCEGEGGFLTIQFLLAVGLSLGLLASLGNVLVQRYALAAVQASLDEGVRAGALVGADSRDCLLRADDALRGLLGGSYGRGVSLSCHRGRPWVEARASGSLPGWAPLVPDLELDLQAAAVVEEVDG